MKKRSVGRLFSNSSMVFMCDFQKKIIDTNPYGSLIAQACKKVLTYAKYFDVPVVGTEHYPKGLGHTIPELLSERVKIFPKDNFTMINPPLLKHMESFSNLKSCLLMGMEAHACILQTFQDLHEKGYDVHIVVDAVSSRTQTDRIFALRQMERSGAFLTTSETLVFGWSKTSRNKNFKSLQSIIRKTLDGTGLVP